MHQMGFALSGGRLEIKRAEQRLVCCRRALRRVERKNIGVTGDKLVEGHPGVQVKAKFAFLICRLWRRSVSGSDLDDFCRARLGAECQITDHGMMGFPCQQQAFRIAIPDPGGGKFRRQFQMQYTRVRIEGG